MTDAMLKITDWIRDHVHPYTAVSAALAVALLMVLVALVRKRAGGGLPDKAGTWASMLGAQGYAAYGMWHVAEAAGMPKELRIFFFAFLEVAFLLFAHRAKLRYRIAPERGIGRAGRAVFVIAAFSGSLSAMHGIAETGSIVVFAVQL